MLMYSLRTTGQNGVKQERTGLSKRGDDERGEEMKKKEAWRVLCAS